MREGFESKLELGIIRFFVKAVVIIAVMVGAVYFSASRDFDNYVREFERECFEAVTGILEDEYTNSQS